MATDITQTSKDAEQQLNSELAKKREPAFPPPPERPASQGETTGRYRAPDDPLQPTPHRDSPATAPRTDEKGG